MGITQPGLTGGPVDPFNNPEEVEQIPELTLVAEIVHFTEEFSCRAYFYEPGHKFHKFEISKDTEAMQGLMTLYLVDNHGLSEPLAQGIITSWVQEFHMPRLD